MSKKQPRVAAPKKLVYTYEAKTENQKKYLEAIDNNTIIAAIGPPGTGKTMLAIAKALDYLFTKNHNGGFKRIVLSRPAVECAGEKLGALPGEIEDKISPFMFPIYDNMRQLISKSELDALIADGRIQLMPLAYARGNTFRHSFVIIDEAQNCQVSQMKCMLTRLDDHSKIILCGDIEQTDIKGKNGLSDAIERLAHISGFSIVEMNIDDIQRNDIVKEIVLAYRKNT